MAAVWVRSGGRCCLEFDPEFLEPADERCVTLVGRGDPSGRRPERGTQDGPVARRVSQPCATPRVEVLCSRKVLPAHA
jgi:hypothetical protein